MPFDGITLFYGPPKVGKTFVALDWAFCVQANIPWQGRDVDPGRSLFVAPEGTSDIGTNRYAALVKHYGVSPEPPPVAIGASLDLLTDDGVDQLLRTLERIGGRFDENHIDLLFIDPVGRSILNLQENDPSSVSRLIASLDRVRSEYGLGVVLVHHTDKDESRGPRGANAFEAAADTVFSLQQKAQGLVLTNTHNRFGRPLEPIPLALTEVEVAPGVRSAVITGEATAGGTSPGADDDLLDALRTFGPEGARNGEWLEKSGLSAAHSSAHENG